MGRREPFFTSPVHGLSRGCSRSVLRRSHNVSSGTITERPSPFRNSSSSRHRLFPSLTHTGDCHF
ncbi:hypothetical protein CN070_30690 [Sinorhizobium meliloti]|nr:hypothetical protein CN070_30690 [Sinorhizobium meliloti]